MLGTRPAVAERAHLRKTTILHLRLQRLLERRGVALRKPLPERLLHRPHHVEALADMHVFDPDGDRLFGALAEEKRLAHA